MELNAYFVAIVAAVALIIEAFICLPRKKSTKETILGMVLILYLSAVVSITLFPLPLDAYPEQPGYNYPINVIPFCSLLEGIASPESNALTAGSLALVYLGNIALFIPLGILIPILIKSRSWTYLTALILGVASSLTIELLQLAIGIHAGYLYRCVDIDDVILNTAGTMIGFLLLKCSQRVVSQRQ